MQQLYFANIYKGFGCLPILMNKIIEDVVRPLLVSIMTLRGLPLFTVGSNLLKNANLNEKQIMILFMIEQEENQALISTIADELFLDPSQVSRYVDTLEDKGLVKRTRTSRKTDKKADRRKVRIEVTDKGLAFLSQYLEERHHYYADIVESFGINEAKEFRQHIERFNDLISKKIESLID